VFGEKNIGDCRKVKKKLSLKKWLKKGIFGSRRRIQSKKKNKWGEVVSWLSEYSQKKSLERGRRVKRPPFSANSGGSWQPGGRTTLLFKMAGIPGSK